MTSRCLRAKWLNEGDDSYSGWNASCVGVRRNVGKHCHCRLLLDVRTRRITTVSKAGCAWCGKKGKWMVKDSSAAALMVISIITASQSLKRWWPTLVSLRCCCFKHVAVKQAALRFRKAALDQGCVTRWCLPHRRNLRGKPCIKYLMAALDWGWCRSRRSDKKEERSGAMIYHSNRSSLVDWTADLLFGSKGKS